MKKLTTLITILFFISSGIFAQVGQIKGVIKDKATGETIPGVSVYIETGGTMNGAATDIDGKYTIKAVNTGTHAVFISAMGYQKKKIYDVLVTSGNITFVDATIAAGIDIGTITVVAERWDVPLMDKGEPGVQHVPPKQFKKSAIRNNPILAITTLTDGLTLAPNGRDVYVRGSRPTSTQFITDGMKSITGRIGIPNRAIGSVKVYTGGVPAQYGDVSGGVIVVETKSYFDLAQEYK